MARRSSATAPRPDDWFVDNRGYIHGGFDTPVFAQAKQKHNARLTSRRNKIKKSVIAGKTSPGADDVKENS